MEKSEKHLAAEVQVKHAVDLEHAAEAETAHALRELAADTANPEQHRRVDRAIAAEREAKHHTIIAKGKLAVILVAKE